MSKKRGTILLFRILPKGFISRLVGYMSRIPLPAWILNKVIAVYCDKYHVHREEIAYPENGFRSFNHFFTRKLKDGVHAVDSGRDSIVAPVDGKVDQLGRIDDDRILQAKGIEYTLSGLVPSDMHRHFVNGSFITIYLSPGDYHRIHAPVTGSITGYLSVPGKLFTVQDFMVRGLKRLYTVNERVISYLETEWGLVAVTKVGAMNVGRITLSYADIVTNKTFRRRREHFYPEGSRPAVEKGEELGIFHIGSTVIVLFQEDRIQFESIEAGRKVRVGERIATFRM